MSGAREFSTRSLQLATFLHASRALPYLRTEATPDGAGKVAFVFSDPEQQGQRLQLEYSRGAVVVARDLFASQTYMRQQITGSTENLNNGESSNERSKY